MRYCANEERAMKMRSSSIKTIALSVLSASCAGAPSVRSTMVYPSVVPADGSSGALVHVRTTAPASSVVLDLAAGGSLAFTPVDLLTYSASLTPEQLLHGYASDDVYRNFVGYLKVTGGSPQQTATSNFFV